MQSDTPPHELTNSFMAFLNEQLGLRGAQNLGGAGGIRTHEWRFCRPLPWATWVPRRISKYSKFGARTCRAPQRSNRNTTSSRRQRAPWLHAGSAPILPVESD